METADGASSAAEAVVPMADSLIERAKQVVETNFVDEAFSVSRWARCRACGGSPGSRRQQADRARLSRPAAIWLVQ